MNWRLVLGLGITFGIVIGLGGLFGSIWIFRCALLVAVAITVLVVSRTGGKVFTNGFITGLLIGLLQAGLSLALWNQYITHNPQLFKGLHNHSSSLLKTSAIIAMIPWSVIWGLIIGILSWLSYRLIGLRKSDNSKKSEGD